MVTDTTRDLLGEGIQRLRAAGLATPRLDAELLFATAVGWDRTRVLAHPEAAVPAEAAAVFRATVARRTAGEPVAYIRRLRPFHGVSLHVDGRVLIPRPETEQLVDLGLAVVRTWLGGVPVRQGGAPLRLVDVGTGSGAIAIALAVALTGPGVEFDQVRIDATDSSSDALDVARANAEELGVADRITFVAADLLPARTEPRYDLVLANLPYIRTDELAGLPRETTFEPVGALDGGPDGLTVIGRLLDRLPEVLVPGGTALLEIGGEQGAAFMALAAERLPGWPVSVEADLAGSPRVAVLSRPTTSVTSAR